MLEYETKNQKTLGEDAKIAVLQRRLPLITYTIDTYDRVRKKVTDYVESQVAKDEAKKKK